MIDPKKGDPKEVVVATTRPETMLGDTAVAVHPDPSAALKDEIKTLKEQIKRASAREQKILEQELEELELREREVLPGLIHLRDMALEGREVMLPLMNRKIPLICDEWAKPSMGSGLVKIK